MVPTIPICVTRGSVVAVGPSAIINYASGIMNGMHNDSHGSTIFNPDPRSLVRRTSRRELVAKGVTFANAERGSSPPELYVGRSDRIPSLHGLVSYC